MNIRVDDNMTGTEGYEWAEENNINNLEECIGNSKSFVEGCKVFAEEKEL